MSQSPFAMLLPIDLDSKAINAIVETPKGSQNKYAIDLQRGVLVL